MCAEHQSLGELEASWPRDTGHLLRRAAWRGETTELGSLLLARADPDAALSVDTIAPHRRVRGGRSRHPKLRRTDEESAREGPLYAWAGMTALSFAVEAGAVECVRLLLAQGATPDPNHAVELAGAGDAPSEAAAVAALVAPGRPIPKRHVAEAARLARHDELRDRMAAAGLVARMEALQGRSTCSLQKTQFLRGCTREPMPGVLAWQLFTPETAGYVLSALEAYRRAASEGHLPFYTRRDGNWAKLEECGFQHLFDQLNDAVASTALADLGLHGLSARHGVLLCNSVEHARRFPVAMRKHQDKYVLTINLCLAVSDDLEGSGVEFFDTAEESPPKYVHRHAVGEVVVHRSSTWHRTQPITGGRRSTLIVWSDGSR